MLAARKRQSAAPTSAQVAIRQTNVVRLLAMLLLAMRTVTRLATVLRQIAASSLLQEIIEADHTDVTPKSWTV